MFYNELNEILQQRYANVDALHERLYEAAHQIADQFASHIGAPLSTSSRKVMTRQHVFAAPVGELELLPEPDRNGHPPGYEGDHLHFDIVVKLDKPSSWRPDTAITVTVKVHEDQAHREIRYTIVDGKAGTSWGDTSNIGEFITRLKGEFEYVAKTAE
jgi:hypothetical protein